MVTLVQSTSGSRRGETNPTINWPATPTAGNLLVLRGGGRNNNFDATALAGAGWSVAVIGDSTSAAAVIAYKIAGVSEATTVTVHTTGSVRAFIGISEWSASAGWPGDPLDVTAKNPSTGVAGDVTELSTETTAQSAVAESLAVAVWGLRNGSVAFTGLSFTNSFTQTYAGSTGTGDTEGSSAGAHRILSATQTVESTLSWTGGTANTVAGVAVFSTSAAAETFTVGSDVVQASIVAILELTGSVSGSGTLAGNLVTVHALSGAVAGAATLTGDLTAVRDLTGALGSVGSLSGVVVIRRVLEGSVSGAATLAGTLEKITPVRELTGAITGMAALAGDLTPRKVLAGSVEGSGSLTGDLFRTANLAGTVSGQGALSGNLTLISTGTFTTGSRVVQATVAATVHDLTGTVSGTAALTGDLVRVHALSGTVAGAGDLAAVLIAIRVLTGGVEGTATLESALIAVRSLAGELGGFGALSGTLTIAEAGVQDLTGQITGTGTVSGSLIATRGLSGAVVGTGTLSGDLGATRVLTGAVEGFGAFAGQLVAVRILTGSIDGQGTLTGNLVKVIFPFLRIEAAGAAGVLTGAVGVTRMSVEDDGAAASSESAGLIGSGIEGG